MPNKYNGRVFHFGLYDGREIEEVVDLDPAYILEASLDKSHHISQEAVSRARRLLDSDEEYDDFYFTNVAGINRSTYDEES